MGRGGADCDAEKDRDHDHARIVSEKAGEAYRRHAHVMHDADAAAEHRAAGKDDRMTPRQRTAMGKHQAKARNNRRDNNGEDGGPQRIAHGKMGRKGQHGDEMRRPDAAAGGEAGSGHPGQLRAVAVAAVRKLRPSPRHQTEGGIGGEKANQTGNDDQPQIMLLGQASIDTQHGMILVAILSTDWSGCFTGRF